MQLPITGHPLHTRSLTTVATMRADGRLQVRGDVNDLRKCGFIPMTSALQPAGIIHQMSIDLVVDPATRRIDALTTDQPFVAVEPSPVTGGECCRDTGPKLEVLTGEVLDAGFAKKLSAAFGGPRGCSHMLTLFQLMASVVPRALDREEALVRDLGRARKADEKLFWCSTFLDGYEAEAGDIELAVQMHEFHGRPVEEVESPLDRFQRHDEVRVFAHVELPSMQIRELKAFERVREAETLASAEWRDRGELVAGIAGAPIVPGLAGRVFQALAEVDDAPGLRDALLQLAPGQIQVMAAITDRWFARARDQGTAKMTGDDGPLVGTVGGMADSCWMWRADGPLGRAREQYQRRDGDA